MYRWGVFAPRLERRRVNKYDLLVARTYIKRPDEIQNRRTSINIQNSDDKCFIYCLGRALAPPFERKKIKNVSAHTRKRCLDSKVNSKIKIYSVKLQGHVRGNILRKITKGILQICHGSRVVQQK